MKTFVAYLSDYRDRNDYFLSMMPVGALSIAAVLEARGHDVTLANYSKEGVRSAAAHIQSVKPDAVGLSVYTHNRTDSLRLAAEIKRRLPKTVVIAGGPHASFLGEEILRRVRSIDYIVRGEGELALAELLARHAKKPPASERIIQGKRIKRPRRAPVSGPLRRYDARHRPQRAVQIPHHQPRLRAPVRILLLAAAVGPHHRVSKRRKHRRGGRTLRREIRHHLFFHTRRQLHPAPRARAEILPPASRTETLYHVELPVAR